MTNIKQQLFDSIVTRQGATVLPGQYGGERNADKLAVLQSEESTTLFLGLKILDAAGGLQLGKSNSGHVQYSIEWLWDVVSDLKRNLSTRQIAEEIERALMNEKLVAGVLCLNAETQQVSMLRIAIR